MHIISRHFIRLFYLHVFGIALLLSMAIGQGTRDFDTNGDGESVGRTYDEEKIVWEWAHLRSVTYGDDTPARDEKTSFHHDDDFQQIESEMNTYNGGYVLQNDHNTRTGRLTHMGEELTLLEEEQFIVTSPTTESMSREDIVAEFQRQLQAARDVNDVIHLLYGPMNSSDVDERFNTRENTNQRRQKNYRATSRRRKNMYSSKDYMGDQPTLEGREKHFLMQPHQQFIPASESSNSNHRKRHARHWKAEVVGDADLAHAVANAKLHLAEMPNLTKCSEPVPECLNFKNLSSSANEDYVPRCTRVYRCRREYGCCDDKHHCGPKHVEYLTAHVFVMRFVNGNIEYSIKSFTYANHTECECKPIQQMIQCLQCPEPFINKIVSAQECRCICDSEDRKCTNIMRGKEVLFPRDQDCVRSNNCQRPSCRGKRQYNLDMGTCTYPVLSSEQQSKPPKIVTSKKEERRIRRNKSRKNKSPSNGNKHNNPGNGTRRAHGNSNLNNASFNVQGNASAADGGSGEVPVDERT